MRQDTAAIFRRWACALAGALGTAALLSALGCKPDPPPPHEEPRWPILPMAAVPDFMHGTLFERIRFTNTDLMPVYGYGLVVNLHGTGDCTAPSWVRDYIAKQIEAHGFDSLQFPRYKTFTAEDILDDKRKRVAIVTVEGLLPVGAREGQRFDVLVHAMAGSQTSSLAHGELYETELSDHGLMDPSAIGARTMAWVNHGQVFVNPAYALSEGKSNEPGAHASLRTGSVLNGGIVKFDRPINLEIRQPQISTARLVERLIARHWKTPTADDIANRDRRNVLAWPQDEGLVQIYVPLEYRGDWKHYLGVVSHLYMNESPDFTVIKAQQLVTEAHKPNAKLADISLCWEALGPEALAVFEPLISDPDPDVAFAAARAAAFLDDGPARQALLHMAADDSQPNQLEAVRTLGSLPSSAETTHMLRSLLDSSKAEVRIEAYRILVNSDAQLQAYSDESRRAAEAQDGIMTFRIGDRFLLDVIPSSGEPMVYATSTGIPRLAVFGHDLKLESPITFTAMDTRFSISSADGTKLLTMFYRDPQSPRPTDVLTHNELVEILARLGGEGPDDGDRLSFDFNDVVAIAQQLVESRQVYGSTLEGDKRLCLFQLQHPQMASESWESIPSDTYAGRPQGGGIGSPAANTADHKAGVGG
jgi:hypothetical protein